MWRIPYASAIVAEPLAFAFAHLLVREVPLLGIAALGVAATSTSRRRPAAESARADGWRSGRHVRREHELADSRTVALLLCQLERRLVEVHEQPRCVPLPLDRDGLELFESPAVAPIVEPQLLEIRVG